MRSNGLRLNIRGCSQIHAWRGSHTLNPNNKKRAFFLSGHIFVTIDQVESALCGKDFQAIEKSDRTKSSGHFHFCTFYSVCAYQLG